MNKSGRLRVTVTARDYKTDTSFIASRLVVSTGVFTYAGSIDSVSAGRLISQDENNYLKLGSDERLLVEHSDTDFIAYYTLKRD